MQKVLTENEIDLLFKALADTTRRKIVELLSQQDAGVKELASYFTHSLPSLMQHINVLEKAGLIRTNKVGRVRTCTIEREKLDVVEAWIEEQHKVWESRFDQLDQFLIDKKDNKDG